jgi:hypothetical protein
VIGAAVLLAEGRVEAEVAAMIGQMQTRWTCGLQVRCCLLDECSFEVGCADDVMLCCCLLKPAGEEREVTVDR